MPAVVNGVGIQKESGRGSDGPDGKGMRGRGHSAAVCLSAVQGPVAGGLGPPVTGG